jgi:SAM-dependent methyltransferase
MLRAMTSVGDNYILPGKEDHDRLRTISDLHDERTHTLLRRAGFAPGCRFAEFGCGLGYVTRWAAAEGAAATGIDANDEQVQACRALARQAGLEGATFRTGSVYEPDFEPGTIDLSYNRWLLVHLNRPVDAMRAIHGILKPGGVMVCEEADLSAIYAEPHSAAYDEMRETLIAAGSARGVDYTGGRRAHAWAKAAGFEIVHVDAYHPHFIEGRFKGFWNWTLRNACRRLVDEGAMTAAQWQWLADGMSAADDDRDTVVAHCRMHQLIARKPLS